MILYKYVDFEGGCKILRNNSIGFRQPLHLNDPTEISAAYPKNDYFNERDFIEMSYRRQLKEYVWRTYYAILSLTRAPNTSLMWSHYAQNHEGFVIGFEVNKDIFSSEKLNIIPVQYGNVIYTTTKPIHENLTKSNRVIEIGTEVEFIPERLESLQRTFLYKPMCWSYEEEVRIVKNIFKEKPEDEYKSGEFQIISSHTKDLFVHNLPDNTIKEIYFGYKNPFIEQKNSHDIKEFYKLVESHSKDAEYYICKPNELTWSFKYNRIVFEKPE